MKNCCHSIIEENFHFGCPSSSMEIGGSNSTTKNEHFTEKGKIALPHKTNSDMEQTGEKRCGARYNSNRGMKNKALDGIAEVDTLSKGYGSCWNKERCHNGNYDQKEVNGNTNPCNGDAKNINCSLYKRHGTHRRPEHQEMSDHPDTNICSKSQNILDFSSKVVVLRAKYLKYRLFFEERASLLQDRNLKLSKPSIILGKKNTLPTKLRHIPDPLHKSSIEFRCSIDSSQNTLIPYEPKAYCIPGLEVEAEDPDEIEKSQNLSSSSYAIRSVGRLASNTSSNDHASDCITRISDGKIEENKNSIDNNEIAECALITHPNIGQTLDLGCNTRKTSGKSHTRVQVLNTIPISHTCPSALSVKMSVIHGYGIFTEIDIEMGTFIIKYEGELISKCMSNMREKRYLKYGMQSIYMFAVNDNLVIDASLRGNKARFINHSCMPNCATCTNTNNNTICYHAIRDIKAGEELTINYNLNFEGNSEECNCGSEFCKSKKTI